MLISVVIPAWNEEKYISRALESVKKNRIGPDNRLEILVVDGSSTDQTSSIAKKFGARVVTEKNRGVGKARQAGLKHARGEIVVFTDADTVVPSDWLSSHCKILLKSGVSAVFGLFKVNDGGWFYRNYINYFQTALYKFFYFFLGIPLASGQNFAFIRKQGNIIGGFNSKLKVMEDIDFCIRIKKTGKVIMNCNSIVISSGRRAREGLGFFFRGFTTSFKYFVFKSDNLKTFPDYR